MEVYLMHKNETIMWVFYMHNVGSSKIKRLMSKCLV